MERERERERERETDRQTDRQTDRERERIYVQRMLRLRNMSACDMVLHRFICQNFQFL